jgi:NADH-quinone oxidoreductase subunit C
MKGIIEKIKQIEGAEVTIRRENRVFVDVPKSKLISALYGMKLLGFNQLSIMSAVDRISEDEFEVFYVLYSYKDKINSIVRTRIPRNSAVIETADKIYPPAHTYERELTEMFGIKVEGNSDSGKPFILENWKEQPPMRKDFDSIGYVNKHYEFRHSMDNEVEGKDE